MKPKTLDLIRKAYDICKESFDATVSEEAADILLSIIRAETCGKTSSKFDIFDFVADDKWHPTMNGILHDKGFKVASDSKLLLMLKESYDKSLEGKIIGREGNVIEGRYPRYEKVMPIYNKDEYTTYTIDFDSFYEQLKNIRTDVYEDCGKKKKWVNQMVVHIGDTWLRAELFNKFISFMQHVGTNELHIKDNAHAVLTFVDENKAIIMPLCAVDYIEHPENYYVITL